MKEAPSPKEARWVFGGRLPALAALGLPVAFLDAGTGLGLATAAVYDAALVLGAFVEGRSLRRDAPAVRREIGGRLMLGARNDITIHLENRTARAVRVVVRDDLPAGWVADPPELKLTLPPHARREVRYAVVPPARGKASFGDLHVRVMGRARLGAAIVTTSAAEEVRVYPNILGARRYDLAARLGDLRQVGFRQIRSSGGGGEFEQLREYAGGDSFRDVDWKSTAKRQRPVTRVYRQERSQQVIIAVDAGRMMATRLTADGEHVAISKLDHAINAALLVAWVALQKGDRVGVLVFSDVVRRFVPPGRGSVQYRRILEALYDAPAEKTHVDFRRFVEFIKLRVPKRALLMMFTDLVDETQARPLVDHVSLLRRKHLPVCVTMEDRIASGLATMPVTTGREAYHRAAAADLLAERRGTAAHLRKNAIDLVEAPPGELSVATVNKYLEIKARNRL